MILRFFRRNLLIHIKVSLSALKSISLCIIPIWSIKSNALLYIIHHNNSHNITFINSFCPIMKSYSQSVHTTDIVSVSKLTMVSFLKFVTKVFDDYCGASVNWYGSKIWGMCWMIKFWYRSCIWWGHSVGRALHRLRLLSTEWSMNPTSHIIRSTFSLSTQIGILSLPTEFVLFRCVVLVLHLTRISVLELIFISFTWVA